MSERISIHEKHPVYICVRWQTKVNRRKHFVLWFINELFSTRCAVAAAAAGIMYTPMLAMFLFQLSPLSILFARVDCANLGGCVFPSLVCLACTCWLSSPNDIGVYVSLSRAFIYCMAHLDRIFKLEMVVEATRTNRWVAFPNSRG